MLGSVKSWFGKSLFGVRDVNLADGLIALVLSVFAIMLTSGATHPGHPHGGFWASLAVLSMTVPVLWRRRAPLGAAATLAAGSLFNGFVIGSMVRCGATLPALALVMFSVGLRCKLRQALGGAVLGIVAVVTMAHYDPKLTSAFSIPGSVLLLALWGVGRLVRSREGMVASLRERTRELGEQRERTAQLAVAAERARVAGGVGWTGFRSASESWPEKRHVDAWQSTSSLELARETLSTIEHEGRRTLADMRVRSWGRCARRPRSSLVAGARGPGWTC